MRKASRLASSACRVCEPCRSVVVDNKKNLDYRAGFESSSLQLSGPGSTPRYRAHGTRGKSRLHWLRRARPPDKGRDRSISANRPQERTCSSNTDSRARAPVEIHFFVSCQLCASARRVRKRCGSCRSMLALVLRRRATSRLVVGC
jgi:hypothetical protein